MKSGRRTAAFWLYLPVVGAVSYYLLLTAFLLVRGKPPAAAGLLYAGVLAVLGRRMSAIHTGEADEASLWKDIAALGVADLLLAVLFFSYFLGRSS